MRTQAVAHSLEAELPFVVTGSDDFVHTALTHPMWHEYVMATIEQRPASDAVVELHEAPLPTYTILPPMIQCTLGTISSGVRLISHLLERERQGHGIYTVHGNVISLGEKAVALIGGISGIGKTALSAQSTTQGWRWIADEKFLIDESCSYRFGRSIILNDQKTHDAAGLVRPTASTPREIHASVIPILTDSALEVHNYSSEKALYHYYEELSRDITGARALFMGYDFPLPSVDTQQLAARRHRAAEHLSESRPMYFMLGTAAAILEAIEQRICDN